jgi:hypothetical protein
MHWPVCHHRLRPSATRPHHSRPGVQIEYQRKGSCRTGRSASTAPADWSAPKLPQRSRSSCSALARLSQMVRAPAITGQGSGPRHIRPNHPSASGYWRRSGCVLSYALTASKRIGTLVRTGCLIATVRSPDAVAAPREGHRQESPRRSEAAPGNGRPLRSAM